jgi:ribosomal protein L11 methyltransferase
MTGSPVTSMAGKCHCCETGSVPGPSPDRQGLGSLLKNALAPTHVFYDVPAMQKWVELRVMCPVDLVDVLSGTLWDCGCLGITETSPSPTMSLLQVSFCDCTEALKRQVEQACTTVFEINHKDAPDYEWRNVVEENWKETHKRFYPAQPLSARFFLVPAWQATEIVVPQGYEPIILEPGRAFGTGLHQSTRLALWLMEEYLEQEPKQFTQVIDVGTGSGILAMAAKKLGTPKVIGTDIDPEAVEVAIENAANNRLTGIDFSTNRLPTFSAATFQMVIANILLRTHVELLQEYARLLCKGGVLILSGLLEGQLPTLEPELKRQGFHKNKSKVIDEWEAVAYLKK